MRAVLASVALFAVSAAAQNIPSCAMACVAQPATLGGCSANDMPCLCASKEFIAATVTCLQTACPASELEAARGVAITLCQAAGVTLDLPTSGVAPAASQTSPAASPSSTSSAPASTASATGSGNGAMSNSVNVIAGLAAIGMAALTL